MQKKFKIHKDDINDFVYVSDKNKIITGKIYNEKYLKIFSNKLYQIYNNINNNYYNKNGIGTSFIYSNLVEIGINIFEEILLQNGYIEYKQTGKYYSLDNVKCYYCGHTKKDHSKSPDKKHKYHPATYIIFTGQKIENVDSAKKEELRAIFNSPDNKDGQIIKFLLGSIVMSEGITLKNIKDIHIMDAHLNKSRLIQAVGRGVRNCSHIDVTSTDNPFPTVTVYTYCSLLSNNKKSSELIIYRHAEIKQEQIKKIEDVLKRNAIDCPLNFEINKKGESSDFKCLESCLNDAYWNPTKKMYKNILTDKLDMSTYDNISFESELQYCTLKIKELYLKNFYYTIDDILKYIYNSYSDKDKNFFDTYFIYQAINKFVLIKEEDFSGYIDKIKDPYQRDGYLIYRDIYYIFQEWGKKESMPLYYRQIPPEINMKSLSLYNYLIKKNNINILETDIKLNDFNKTKYYYANRPENNYVGIIEIGTDNEDIFKIRKKLSISSKNRGKGILTYKGSICNKKSNEYLLNVCKHLEVTSNSNESRDLLCDKIKEKLLDLEKYSNNKKTYIILPINHPHYKFPYNLEDRSEYIKNNLIEKLTIYDRNISIKKQATQIVITIDLKETNIKEENIKYLQQLNAIFDKNKKLFNIIIK